MAAERTFYSLFSLVVVSDETLGQDWEVWYGMCHKRTYLLDMKYFFLLGHSYKFGENAKR
jgi:hypothetical protein